MTTLYWKYKIYNFSWKDKKRLRVTSKMQVCRADLTKKQIENRT